MSKQNKMNKQNNERLSPVDVLERYRHNWLEALYDNMNDNEFITHAIYDSMVDGVLGFQSAIEHLE